MKYYRANKLCFTNYKNEWKDTKIWRYWGYKKEFHKSKQTVDLDLVNVDQIVISDKFNHSNDGFKYFIGHKEDNIVKLLYVILPQMSGYIKYFENRGKDMFFVMKDDSISVKCNEIWNKFKRILNTNFHSMSVYDERYIRAKVREFNGVSITNFLGDKYQKKTCITLA